MQSLSHSHPSLATPAIHSDHNNPDTPPWGKAGVMVGPAGDRICSFVRQR